MKIKISEATNLQLDWMVAKCVAQQVDSRDPDWLAWLVPAPSMLPNYHPTTDWAQGGPIIEREEIGTKRRAPCMKGEEWEARGSITAKGAGYSWAVGPTPLVAAMRCYVANKLGDEVEVPDELGGTV